MHFITVVAISRSLSSIHFRKRASEPGTSEGSTSKHAKPDSCVSMPVYKGQVENFYILVLQAMQALSRSKGLVFTQGASRSASIGDRHVTLRSESTGMTMCVNKIETMCKKPQLFIYARKGQLKFTSARVKILRHSGNQPYYCCVNLRAQGRKLELVLHV